MNTRETLFRINPAWVAVGAFVLAAQASGQLRRHHGNLQVGHSEQGRVTEVGTHVADDNKQSGFRLTYGGDSDKDLPSFGGAANVDFRKQDRMFREIDRRPMPQPSEVWLILVAGDETPGAIGAGSVRRSGGAVPAPATVVLLLTGAAAVSRRRRVGV